MEHPSRVSRYFGCLFSVEMDGRQLGLRDRNLLEGTRHFLFLESSVDLRGSQWL